MELRSKIETTISQWRTRTDKPPPFTCAEAVVMALALHDEPLSAIDICLWIYSTFAFYKRLGVKAGWKYLDNDDGDTPCDPWSLSPSLRVSSFEERVLHSYDVPARRVPDEEGQRETRWTVEPAAARLFLRSRLWPEDDERSRGEPFPFLDLPPDIRNEIYTMVFSFPPSGVQIGRHDCDRSGTLYTISKEFELPSGDFFEPWRQGTDHIVDAGSLSRTLSLLAVNRQIRSEALYVFPSINTFYFTSAAHMSAVLRRMSAQHRDQIRDIAFHHSPSYVYPSRMAAVFGMLAEMRRLRRLRVYIDQEEWFGNYWYRRLSRSSVQSVMGFDGTPRLPDSVELVVSGDCPSGVVEQIRAEPVVERRAETGKVDGGEGRVIETPPLAGKWSFNGGFVTMSGLLGALLGLVSIVWMLFAR